LVLAGSVKPVSLHGMMMVDAFMSHTGGRLGTWAAAAPKVAAAERAARERVMVSSG
jgi:hypothetical protein